MKKNELQQTPKTHWAITVLIGMVLVASGVAIAFFPKMAMSIALIVTSVLFFAFGITDSISALRYKKTETDWKANLGNGLITLLVGIFIFATIYVPTITPMIVLILLCFWAVLRCILLIVGFIIGKTKKKANLLQAVLMGTVGICAFLFRDFIFASTKIIGYAIIGIGALVLVYAFMKKSSAKAKEAELTNKTEELPNEEVKEIETGIGKIEKELSENGAALETVKENDKEYAEVESIDEV